MEYEVEAGDLEVLQSHITEANYVIVENKVAADDEMEAKIKNQMDDLLRDEDEDEEDEAPQNQDQAQEDQQEGDAQEEEEQNAEGEGQDTPAEGQQPQDQPSQQQNNDGGVQPTTAELVKYKNYKKGKNCEWRSPASWRSEKASKT